MPTHLPPLASNSTSSSLLELEVRANAALLVTMTEGTARGVGKGAMVVHSSMKALLEIWSSLIP